MSPTLDKKNLTKLQKLKNRHVLAVVKKYINLCQPHKVTVLTGSAKDLAYVRKLALENGEEHPLSTPGHTVHFDGYFDQGRDTQQTKVLLKKGQKLGDHINCGKRKVCL
ncbi:MAG: phosphoenolpyruvate carboxykinase (GTP), partial [Candidatus Omnitrophica bacterium]|nr:phosphoenolpyruvate carboxykinase (GTP) [Candidatus Omnitrophota bacterium]